MNLSRYLSFTRSEWALLRGKTPLTLNEADLQALRGVNERLDLDEVRDIYLPLSRLLNLSPDILCVNDLYFLQAVLAGSSEKGVLQIETFLDPVT